MSRPNEGKTETCLKRAVTVYPRSFEQKERWKSYAENRGMKLSAFVIGAVEAAIAPDSEADPISVKDLQKQIDQLREEIVELRKEKEVYKKLYETQDKELRRYRAEPFLKEEFEGVRRYNKELVETLRSSRRSDRGHKVLSNDELLSKLGIDPSESDAVKSIYNQLENLGGYGLVKLTAKGWRWIE